ncbi:putative nucleoside triphosphate pyrophosphohydrolase [Vibrio phage pVco-14]|nr:putative nucleoside triphosphate pyrophosphohydrolase [Vibrio phage pVco-14]
MQLTELDHMAFQHGFDVIDLEEYQDLKTSQKLQVWSLVRNFPEGACIKGQGLKLTEENSEIFEALIEHDRDKFIDAVGDSIVVIGIIAHMKNYDVDVLTKDRGCPEYWLNTVDFDRHIDNACFVATAFSLQRALGMVAEAIAKNKGLIVPINNFMKELCALTHMVGFDPMQCFNAAFSEIENRRGRMIEGVFVKQDDL